MLQEITTIVPGTDPTPCPLSFLLPPHSLRMKLPPYIYFFSLFTWVLPESTRLQPPQYAADLHLSMNIKIMIIVLTTSAPAFSCFNNTQDTDVDHFLTHIAAGLATVCNSPVLDRKKKKKPKRWIKMATTWCCRYQQELILRLRTLLLTDAIPSIAITTKFDLDNLNSHNKTS